MFVPKSSRGRAGVTDDRRGEFFGQVDQLSPLDASFLRLETPDVHMHVGWVSLFAPRPKHPRPTVEGLRASIAARLPDLPRFRQRLAFPPAGLSDPFWVEDRDFDLAAHVLGVGGRDEPMPLPRFDALAATLLSEPLDRRRPLWQFALVPRLADGRIGLISKLHHALTDGVAAMELGAILFDATPDPPPPPAAPSPDTAAAPPPPPGPLGLAVAAVESQVELARRTGGRLARAAAAPRATAAGALADTRRIAAVARDTVAAPAPASPFNRPIGPERRLLRYGASAGHVLDVRAASGATFNDVCLAVVAGGLRALTRVHFGQPAPLRAVIPVNVRDPAVRESSGNRLSFAFVELPLDLRDPRERVEAIHAQTQRLKAEGLTGAAAPIIAATAFLPPPLKAPVARLATAGALFNLTVSTVPGPRLPIYMLGARLDEAYPFAPLAADHALSIAVLSYVDGAYFGAHVDPVALPQADDLPELFAAELATLRDAYGVSAMDPRPALPASDEALRPS
jgi:diacylglycerol O-acyltransferase / wax synthase